MGKYTLNFNSVMEFRIRAILFLNSLEGFYWGLHS